MKLARQLGSLLASTLLLFSVSIQAEIKGEEVSYSAGDLTLKGFMAYDDAVTTPRPAILVVHEWWGHNAYARERATLLAKAGYVALAVDMYGDGKTADHPKEAGEFMKAAMADKAALAARFHAAVDVLQQHSAVDKDAIAAIGYCFGGAVVLEMARRGATLAGVASFHGSLGTDNPAKAGEVQAKVIVFHGEADRLIPADVVEAFKQEMTAAEVDFTFVNYPDVQHSFTNPDADELAKKFDLPLAYDKAADEDSWEKLQEFLTGLFTAPNE
ncbi:dienelactone hydrolase family protein [Thioflexithrix psekupsensis]|uniref:Dienelactone hydrolase n=1 Tax=Thioflexithrix psekupsensis TaxID=1570016 RepID=A0A251XBX9_9GAMM|nr:dienelactone hydrolase family protein [Thioflexithrix psekupsensis]OUD15556.1 dienelactone hydrolase [Thioflexithrix psekupsensis]